MPSAFTKPSQSKRNETPIWDTYIEPLILAGELRDVSNTSSLKKGIETSRARIVDRNSLNFPTFMKNQNQQCKDSIYIYDKVRGKYYFPSNDLIAEAMGIEMDFSAVSGTIQSQICGQAVEVPLHDALLKSIKKHILEANMQLSGKLF